MGGLVGLCRCTEEDVVDVMMDTGATNEEGILWHIPSRHSIISLETDMDFFTKGCSTVKMSNFTHLFKKVFPKISFFLRAPLLRQTVEVVIE